MLFVGAELMCQWTNCSQSFEDELHLQRHVIQEHVGANEADIDGFECMWTNCANTMHEFKDKDEMAMHLGTHFDDGQQIAVPVSHTMNGDDGTTMIDYSEPQGIAFVAAHLLRQLSKDPHSHHYFMPYETELLAIARRQPKMAPHIQSMFSHFSIASSSS